MRNNHTTQMEYLEAGINEDWDLYPSGGRELDSSKVQEYLQLLPQKYLKGVRFVLDNTNYVSFDTFKQNLQRSFEMFRQEIGNRPFYLVYPMQGKIGSENWLVHLLYPEIREMNLVDVLDNSSGVLSSVPRGSHILLVDDAVYSGCNIAGTIDEMTYPRGSNMKLIFHLLVPYAKRGGMEEIKNLYSEFEYNFYPSVIMVDTDELSGNDPQVAKFNDDLGAEDSPVAIYFDWKVANEFGSYPQLYLYGAIPRPRKEIDKHGGEWKNVLSGTGPLLKELPTREPINRVIQLIADVNGR